MNQTQSTNGPAETSAPRGDEPSRLDLGADAVIGALVVLISVAAFAGSGNYARENMPVSPEVYPRLLAGMLFPLGLYLLARSVRELKRSTGPSTTRSRRIWPVIVTVFLALVLYVMVMAAAGYVVSTIAYLVFMMVYLGERRPVAVGIWALAVTLVLYISFQQLLRVPLPEGWLWS